MQRKCNGCGTAFEITQDDLLSYVPDKERVKVFRITANCFSAEAPSPWSKG